MKKILTTLALIAFAACHTDSPYAFDVPKILAMDGRKIPAELGEPFKTFLTDETGTIEQGDLAKARYRYVKGQYTISIFYYRSTGVVEDIRASKIIQVTDKTSSDIETEEKKLALSLNLKNIDRLKYKVDSASALNQSGGPLIIHAGISLMQPMQGADTSGSILQPALKP